MIAKPKNSSAASTNLLKLTDGANLCCGDDPRYHYQTAAINTSTHGTVSHVNVTVPGGSAQTVALTGAAIDWTDTDNDEALIQAIGEVATDLDFLWMGGGIELIRGTNTITIRITDSVLEFNWIGTTTTNEAAFTQLSAY